MATNGFKTVALAASGRAVFGPLTGRLDVALIGGLGGGVASLQASYEDTPNPATAAHWVTLNGAETLAVGKVYSVDMDRCTGFCVNLATATAPTLSVVFS